MTKPLLFIVVAGMAMGCALPMRPDPAMLRAQVLPVATDCTDIPLEEATKRLESGLRRCFEKNSPSMPVMSGNLVVGYSQPRQIYFVQRQTSATGTGLLVRHLSEQGNVLMVADLQETQSCRAQVVLRGTNSAWESIAQRSTRHLHRPMADCS